VKRAVVEPFVDRTPGLPDVRGFLHRPVEPNGDALVLTHGAGSNADNPLLVVLAAAFAEAGTTVLRCNLPFRQLRATGPPSPRGALTDRTGLRQAVRAARALVPGRVVLGGHSYGGRQATILAATEPGLATALLALSYPLHPPTRPTDLRTAHFPDVRVPVLFVHGATDPFGTIGELETALTLIAAPTRLVAIDGVGHDLGRGRRAPRPGTTLAALVVSEVTALLAAPARVRRA
jgi:predicted alpha/beta-hydrolase family hydrolase